MHDPKQLWDSVLLEMEMSLPKATFSTWFKDTFIVKFDEGVVHLSVPNQFTKEWLYNKYHKTILKALRDLSESIRNIEYVISKEPSKRALERRPAFEHSSPELPLADHYINKDDNLNPRYTFDSFVVGPFNELAHAAAQAVVKTPGIAYNPLFIYGDTGHGKTHLIQAIGNYFKHHGGGKVYYITSEKFTIDCVNSIQENKMNNFKERYRAFDVFIMDDIQFLSKKERTQEELFHIFNALHDNNKQIIFSSDKNPQYIPNLEERLKSRFAAGMMIDIPAPDHESRLAILKTKASQHSTPLSEDAFSHIADIAGSNIRELEGALNAVILQTQVKGRELALTEIRQLIKDNAKPKRAVSIKDVIKTISDFYDIEEASIYEKTRRKEVVKPRQLIMYILREDFKISYPTIGDKLGGRDHTTVIHSCEKIKRDLKEDALLSQEVQQIRALLL